MPQLDCMHFFTQFFWLCCGSLFLYLYLFHYILPQLYTILVFRKKKLLFLNKNLDDNKESTLSIQKNYDNLLSKCFSISSNLLIHTDNSCIKWCADTFNNIYFPHFHKTNLIYLQIIAELHYFQFLSNHFAIETNKIHFSKNIFFNKPLKIRLFIKKFYDKNLKKQASSTSSQVVSNLKKATKKQEKKSTNKTKTK